MPGQTTFPKNITFGKGVKTATAVAGAATLNQPSGKVTSEALVTAAGATYTLTLTNPQSLATDNVQATASMGTATTGNPVVTTAKPANGSIVFVVQNVAGAAALNGTIVISYVTFGG